MTEGSVRGTPEEGFVTVLDTYSYQRNGRTLAMIKGETLMLLKRATDDWWQVIRQGEKRSFWAPAKYLRVINIPPEQMKQNLKQGQVFEKVPGTWSSEDNVPTGKPVGLSLPLDGKCMPQASEMPSPSNPLASQSYLTKIEMGRISMERSDPFPVRSMSTSSFKSESPHVPTKGLPPRSSSNELLSPGVYSRGLPPQASHESSSSHTSRSSLYDGSRCSTESLTHPHGKKHVMKAASHDELSSGDHCRSSLDISQPRAASSEELDGRYSGRDYLFRSNQLSYRHRSNSVDFKIFQKDLSFSEMKQGSLDKGRKPRLSKDPGNRRRSWAVEEMRMPDGHRPSLKKGETQDVSLILDVPPKLPPKQKKNRLTDMFVSGSENIGKLEGPIDIKVQEVKSNKPALPQTAPNAKRLSQEYDRANLAKVSETLLASDNQRRGFAGRYEGQERKEVPVALPRKMLPPQVSSFDEKLEPKSQVVSGPLIPHSTFPGDTLTRDNNGNQVKSERRENDSEHGSYQEKTRFGEGGEERQKFNAPSSFGKIPGTPDLLRKMDKTPDSTRKVYAAQDITRSWGFSDPSVKPVGKRSEDIKEEEEEKEKEFRYPPRETPTPDSSRGGKSSSQFPSSPTCSPKRELFCDWGEYWDEASRRLFYYNRKTREKRWKPPRKDMPSIAIPEVPPHGRGDRLDLGGRLQPRSPPPDYPSSPKTSHKPWYNNQQEGGGFPPLSRSSTLNFSSNHSPQHPMATSHTLPAFTSNSTNRSGGCTLPLNTPLAPPASAKPLHIPSTPTSPKSPDIPEFSEADQKSALLDVLYNLSPPKGWLKKYDAFTQRVYFHNIVTGERPKEAVWMTEMDLASHENKQYMRKSYQSMMEFTKERQLEADVVETSDVGVEFGSRSENTAKWQRNTKVELSEKSSPIISLRDNMNSKVAPPKPPRKNNADSFLSKGGQKNVEVVTITSNTRSPLGEVRCLGGIHDTPSVLLAGCRVSSFVPSSSSSSRKGHSRSKSESLKAEQLSAPVSASDNLKNSKGQLLVSEEKVLGYNFEQKSTSPTSPRRPPPSPMPRSKSSAGSKSPVSRDDRKFHTLAKTPQISSRKQDQVEQEKLIKQEDVVTGKGHSKYSQVRKLNLNEKERGHFLHDGSEIERNEDNHLDEHGRRSPFASEQFDKMLKELSSHNIMSPERRLVRASSSKIPVPLSEHSSLSPDDAKCRGGRDKTLFFPSNFLGPSLKISPPGEISVPSNSVKSLRDIRKSTFVSHDEDGFLLEDKSLLLDNRVKSNLPSPKVIRSDVGLRNADPVSPGALSPESCSDTQSDQDESMYSDDVESSLLSNTKSGRFQAPRTPLELEKWLATNTEEGKIYYYEESGSKSQWKLAEQDEYDNSFDGKETANRSTSPNENLRISLIQENLKEFSNNIEKEGFVHRTFIMREGKKCRKNWTQSYVRYIIGQFNTGSSGLLHFSKNKDDDKKAELFEFYNVCHLERTNDKKTSRQQVLGLRNSRDTEVLLQFDDRDIADEWLKILSNHEGMQYDDTPLPEKEDKKGKRGLDKVKRESSMDNLNADNKGITDKLRSFIKRRPLKETLEKKGIYKEAVFGSTLAELASQDKTGTPIFVLQCINHIEKSEENLCTDGLYRISGNAAQIQKIRYEVAQRNYSILSREKDVHNLAGSLKLFFRELKEPLIPYANYVDFIQATGSEFRRMNQQAEKLNKAVRKLPSENYETLNVLLQHLLRVTEHESENRMSVSNLAIVFGPCLLWPKETTSSDLMTDVMLHNRVIEGLLTDFPKVFTSKR